MMGLAGMRAVAGTMLTVVLAAGCASGAARPLTVPSETGPITFAIGSDDIGWLGPVKIGRAHV